MTELTL